jgi:MoaA/NifB/PqqE/SkfB family radical SAM enzyme
MTQPMLVSIELTNLCSKAEKCASFGCYAKSSAKGATFWKRDILADFIRDLAHNGIEAVSFGGGEPLQYPGLWGFLDLICAVPIFKSMTTNGLGLTEKTVALLSTFLDKVHVSIHFPEDDREVERVIRQVEGPLKEHGLKTGINFIVKGWDVEKEKTAVRRIRDAGIEADRVVFLPLRGRGVNVDVARFREVASVLSPKFQSTWCLLECRKSDRFISINWEGRVGWCSYTEAKTQMEDFSHAGMMEALGRKRLTYCG